jgi:serine protease Do
MKEQSDPSEISVVQSVDLIGRDGEPVPTGEASENHSSASNETTHGDSSELNACGHALWEANHFSQLRVKQAELDSGVSFKPAKEHFPSRVVAVPRFKRQSDSLTHALTVLATISLMLLSARFVIPQIVEEMRYAWHRGELRAEYQSGRDGLRNVSLDALSDAYQMVTSAVGPSVAHIDVERRLVSESEKLAQQFFRGGMPPTDQGSGVIVDQDGYILTNRHVILGGESISVTLSDGRQLSAEVVGSDALTDLALLKIQADDLLPIAWGDSDDSKVGAPVWAVGSPFGLDRTITFGILSGKHRMVRASTQYQDFMQSDVAVNPGNSGGPLVNARGRLIGINTAIVGDTYQGVSFSIPSNVAKQVYLQLRSSGRVERGWLGVKLRDVVYDPQSGESPRLRGALVDYLINDEAPAAIAGMLEGDRIRSVNDVRIEDMAHLMRVIGSTLIGSTVSVQIDRGSEEIKLDVVLGARPSELNQQ